ncbi:MAG: hypothetical protein M1330_04065, partial [Armatimonadetes bacterium]|nr:hypothetical protein [Armatimonadota bacterium]
ESPPSCAARNMALDEALHLRFQTEPAAPILRLYAWEAPSITIGRFQNYERAKLEMRRGRWGKAPMERRITGGRAVAHDKDLTLAIICSLDDLPARPAAISKTYELFKQPIVAALGDMGYKIHSAQDHRDQAPSAGANCFDRVGVADISDVAGRKLAGGAIRRRASSILFQCSMQCDPNQVDMLRAALMERFARWCAKSLKWDSPTDGEEGTAEQLISERYLDADWLERGIDRVSSSICQ